MELYQNNEELWEQAVKKFNKTIPSLDEDVTSLQEWLNTQHHLPKDILNSNCLRNFVILNKFSVELAKQKIDNYFTLRLKFEEIYGKCDPKLEFNEILQKAVFIGSCPTLTKEMYRVFYFKFKDENLVDLYDAVSQIKRMTTIQDLRLQTDVMCGDIIITDFKGLTLSTLMKVTPLIIYRMIKMYEKIYSIPLKGVYIINLPPFGSTLLALFKKVMKPKLFQRLQVIDDINTIKELLPLDSIPKDFGGEGPSMNALEEALNKLNEKYSELFSRLNKMTINEDLRPGKMDDEIFGICGNFKKLDVD